MSSVVRMMRPAADEVSGSPLRSAAGPWKRPKFQNGSKPTAQPEEKRAGQSEVRHVIGQASSSSSESLSREEELAPERPASPKAFSASRLRNHVDSPLAAVGQLVAERSQSLRAKGVGREPAKRDREESNVTPSQDRQPVANSANVSEGGEKEKDTAAEKSGMPTPEVVPKLRSRSKVDATAGIAALAAGLGGALPTQHGKKGMEQIRSRSPCPDQTPSAETDDMSKQHESELKSSTTLTTRTPQPVSPKPRRRQFPAEISSSKLAAETNVQTKAPVKTPTNSPVLPRRIPPKPSPKPSPHVSQSSSPVTSPLSSPVLPRKTIRPSSPGRPPLLNTTDRKTTSLSESPVMSPKGSPHVLRKTNGFVKANNDGDAVSTESADPLKDNILLTVSKPSSDVESLSATPDLDRDIQLSEEDVPGEAGKQLRDLLDLDIAVSAPRLNTSAAQFKRDLGAKGGLSKRRKPTRQHVRQAFNEEQEDAEEANDLNDSGEVSPKAEAETKPKPSLFKKPFSSVREQRVTPLEKPSTGSKTFERTMRPASPMTPKSPTSFLGLSTNPMSPRQRTQTFSPPMAPVMLLDLQRSPLMMKRHVRNETAEGGGDKQGEEYGESDSQATPPSARRNLRRVDSSGTLGSRVTNSPSLGSIDALQTDDSMGSKQSLSMRADALSQNRSPSRFQVYTAFDWSVNDVASWLLHKLKMDDEISNAFRDHGVDGEKLLVLDANKIKAMGVGNSKTVSALKKEIKSLKSKAEKERKEERKRQEREAKLEKKRQEAAEKEAKALGKERKT